MRINKIIGNKRTSIFSILVFNAVAFISLWLLNSFSELSSTTLYSFILLVFLAASIFALGFSRILDSLQDIVDTKSNEQLLKVRANQLYSLICCFTGGVLLMLVILLYKM